MLVDARGMACPEPVLMVKKAVDKNPKGFQILVDNVTARENIKRFSSNLGYNVAIKEEGEDFLITINK